MGNILLGRMSFQSPARTESARSVMRQKRYSCGASLFSPLRKGSKFTPSVALAAASGFLMDVPNACVSGVLAIAIAKRFIKQGTYDHVFVAAGDLVTQFILSGFQAFQALSSEPCRPYCKTRSGINIGEVGASVLVTKDRDNLIEESVSLIGEASCNDANHISGPSRTGEGLFRSVTSALNQANLSAENIDYISAHGTATLFNDEMEVLSS